MTNATIIAIPAFCTPTSTVIARTLSRGSRRLRETW
jgi:hypothetical protein